jgi:glutamyl-tRNA reductase
VAAGIDSMVVGEAQILSQVREAFQAAQAERTVGPVLSALFARAIKVGRRARSETGIGAGLASTVTVGLRVADAQLGGLAGRRALLVGRGRRGPAGRPGPAQGRGGELVVANRTPATGAALARELAGRAVPLDRVAEELALADLAVAATAGTTPTVTAATVADALARRTVPRRGRRCIGAAGRARPGRAPGRRARGPRAARGRPGRPGRPPGRARDRRGARAARSSGSAP